MALLIKDIEPKGNRNETHPTEENLPELVEEPLLEACIRLVRKNIKTVATTANKNNIGEHAELLISADGLSPQNRELAMSLDGEEVQSGHWGNIFVFTYPLREDSTVEEVQIHFNRIAESFEIQPYTWARKSNFADTIEMIYGSSQVPPEMKAWIANQTEIQDNSSGKVWRWDEMVREAVAEGAYYDADSGYLYDNKTEYDREQAAKRS